MLIRIQFRFWFRFWTFRRRYWREFTKWYFGLIAGFSLFVFLSLSLVRSAFFLLIQAIYSTINVIFVEVLHKDVINERLQFTCHNINSRWRWMLACRMIKIYRIYVITPISLFQLMLYVKFDSERTILMSSMNVCNSHVTI